jgi:hypothetical protein
MTSLIIWHLNCTAGNDSQRIRKKEVEYISFDVPSLLFLRAIYGIGCGAYIPWQVNGLYGWLLFTAYQRVSF